MVYLIITVVTLLAIFIYQYFAFRGVYYSCLAFHKFRELRYKSVMSLSDNLKSGIPLQEIEDHNDFLVNINSVIAHLATAGPAFVKFKFIKYIYLNIIFSSDRLSLLKKDKSSSLEPYKMEFSNAFSTLYGAIPLWRLRLFVHIFQWVLKIAVQLGFIRFETTYRNFKKLVIVDRELHNDNHDGCLA